MRVRLRKAGDDQTSGVEFATNLNVDEIPAAEEAGNCEGVVDRDSGSGDGVGWSMFKRAS